MPSGSDRKAGVGGCGCLGSSELLGGGGAGRSGSDRSAWPRYGDGGGGGSAVFTPPEVIASLNGSTLHRRTFPLHSGMHGSQELTSPTRTITIIQAPLTRGPNELTTFITL